MAVSWDKDSCCWLSRSHRIQWCRSSLLAVSLPVQLHTRSRLPTEQQQPRLPFSTKFVNVKPFYHTSYSFVFSITINCLVLVWLKFLCFPVSRRISGRTQAGERSEEAAGVEEARVASEGERLIVSEQTPQEPRWAEKQRFIKCFFPHVHSWLWINMGGKNICIRSLR